MVSNRIEDEEGTGEGEQIQGLSLSQLVFNLTSNKTGKRIEPVYQVIVFTKLGAGFQGRGQDRAVFGQVGNCLLAGEAD